MGPVSDSYKSSVGLILTSVLGWNDGQFNRWMKRTGLEECLTNPDDLVYHQPPEYWAVEPILDHYLGRGRSDQRMQTRMDLLELLYRKEWDRSNAPELVRAIERLFHGAPVTSTTPVAA